MKFLSKILSPTILTISSLLLIYIFYKSEIIHDGKIREYYLEYYLIALIFIIFSIVIFFISEKIKVYIVISGISLVMSLYLFEGYLIIKKPVLKIRISPDTSVLDITSFNDEELRTQLLKEQLYKEQTGMEWDQRTKSEIYDDIKKINNEIRMYIPVESYYNKNYRILPLSGVSNSETIFCNENGFYSIYQSDRFGFNNPNDQWNSKEIEYLLVGDSYVHGACVNRPNDISSILRTLSNKTVLNLSYSGNGPLIEYATLREYSNSNVKKVLWFYFEGNDLFDLKKEKKNKTLMKYLNDLSFSQRLKSRQNEINEIAINLIKKERKIEKEKEKEIEIEKKGIKLKLIKFISIEKIRSLIFNQKSMTEFGKIIKLAKDLTTKNNSKLYVVYIPSYYRYKDESSNTNYNSFKNILKKLNIPLIDINEEFFKNEENPLKYYPFEQQGHFTEEGYKKITQIIYKFTKD